MSGPDAARTSAWLGCYFLSALGLALVMREVLPDSPWFAPLGLGALLTLAILPFAARHAGWLFASLLALAPSVPFAAWAALVLARPLFEPLSRFDEIRFGVAVAAPLFAVSFAAAGLLAFRASRASGVSQRRVLRVFGVGALAIAIPACALAVRKAAAHADIRTYRASLEPSPVCLPEVAVRPTWPRRVEPGAQVNHDMLVARARRGGEWFSHRLELGSNSCEVEMDAQDGRSARTILTLPLQRETHQIRDGGELVTWLCPELCLTRIAADSTWLVRGSVDQGLWPPIAFTAPTTRAVPSLEGLRDRIAPPRPWVVSAVTGVFLAGMIALFFRRNRALAARLAWPEVELGGRTVLASPNMREGSYRGSADLVDPALYEVGTRAELVERIAREGAARWALALAVIALTVTPLLVACAWGLAL